MGRMKFVNVRKTRLAGLLIAIISVSIIIFSIVYMRQEDEIVYPRYVAYVEDVEYTIQTSACDNDIYLLVLVGSHPDHSSIRKVIRNTWGNPRISGFNFKLVFLFGEPPNVESQYRLEEESSKYGDIIQGNFDDSYHNITTRDLMGLKWAWEQCQQARFIVRADDDIAFDIYYLIDVLEDNFTTTKDFVACFYITKNATVERDGRYALSVEDYPNQVYPDFCHGWMYVLTPSTAYKLVKMSSKIQPFWINDVYITGTLVKALNMKVQDLFMNYTLDFSVSERLLSKPLPLPYKVLPTKAKPYVTQKLQKLYKENALMMGWPTHKMPTKLQSPL